MCSAHAVQLKLESQTILERAFAEYPVSLCGGAVTYVLKKLKRQNTRTIHIFITITIWVYVNKAVPAPSLMQGLSSGADRPLSGSWGGQSPGCLVQTKASHIALLCLLTTWLCHQVLLTITYHANSAYHALRHGTHAE